MTPRWDLIDDHILNERIVQALKAMREQFGYSLGDALDAFSERYQQLRERRADEFTVSADEYGKNFYS